jgi:hypothetical protein
MHPDYNIGEIWGESDRHLILFQEAFKINAVGKFLRLTHPNFS